MKIKNTSDGEFNLKSGKLQPGKVGEANMAECKVLFSSNKCEEVVEAPKPVAKPKAKPNG